MSLATALKRFPELVQDLAHWHAIGITTEAQLGEYLDVSCAHNVYKSDHGISPPEWWTVAEYRAYLLQRQAPPDSR